MLQASPVIVTPFDTCPTVGANCRGFVTAGVTMGLLEVGGKVDIAFRRWFSSSGENDITWFSLSNGDKDLPPVVSLSIMISIS